MIAPIVLASMAILGVGYFTYGRFLSRRLELDDARVTPAVEVNDGVDYVPAKAQLLLGQHFSAIAAAGPIVGPILAGVWFGWVPAILWILLGSIFVGGVHDFASLVASVRHRASSIGEVVRAHMSPTSHVLFLIFVWFALVYVIIAFTDITAQTFKTVAADSAPGPGVAAGSILYLALGIFMGLLLRFTRLNLGLVTAIFLPLVLFSIWAGTQLPPSLVASFLAMPVKSWEALLLAYCFIASLLPMWMLLQPRGYLGGWFLYLTMAVALIGAIFGGFDIRYPAFNMDGLKSLENGRLLFPIVFITIACGACSGFHGIVSSGTTSKQISRESDTRVIGYGAMLLEGLVAVLALATVMALPKGDAALKGEPNFIFAQGIAGYLARMGISYHLALSFALLAFSTFVYDTLDVCTRLARYILQELLNWKSLLGGAVATFVTLLAPLAFLMATKEKGYLVAWPIFGTSNQLLASLTLLAISVWLLKTGRRAMYALIPMAFMLIVTLMALVLQIFPFLKLLPAWLAGNAVKADVVVSGICGIILLVLSVWLVIEAARVLARAGAFSRLRRQVAEPVKAG
ncbi:MAG: carbon starvation protein A [Candidatus Eisenbacteria bacterium]|nr:carbon starvation protein A [Candidatus Eisenbacteria bacterium]